MRLKPLGEAPLPARHLSGDARQRGDELRALKARARVIGARKMESESHDNIAWKGRAAIPLLAPVTRFGRSFAVKQV
jgi:hypothetical protein